MRLATFVMKSERTRVRVGALCGNKMLDLAQCAHHSGDDATPASSMRGLLDLGERGLDWARGMLERPRPEALHLLEKLAFLPPVPDADKFLCVGKNYRKSMNFTCNFFHSICTMIDCIHGCHNR